MRALRTGVLVITLVVAGGSASGVRADGSPASPAQSCPPFGGWVLYRSGPGGSAGIQGVYTASHGDCVSFFQQHPEDTFVAVSNANPHP